MDHLNLMARPARALMACATIAFAAPALAQTSTRQIGVSAADTTAAAGATFRFISATPKSTQAGVGTVLRTDLGGHQAAARGASAAGGSSRRHPADLVDNGGATLPSAVQHTVYSWHPGSACNSPACWGNADQFLKDLDRSNFIHVLDQYVGSTASNRYPYAGYPLGLVYTKPALPLTDADMAAWAHAAASAVGGLGRGHVFHIFLGPDQDVCFDATYSVCASNYFCAYHSAAVFSDGTEVLYTVEPYALVPGCLPRPGTPNGNYDATYDVLSHELFETITDPEGSAWWNSVNFSLYGQEIGDECVFLSFAYPPDLYSDPAVVNLNGHAYAVQSEYSNAAHACATTPGD